MNDELLREQAELLQIFTRMLQMPTQDGGNKRARGEKPNWRIDSSHLAAAERHRLKRLSGERYDRDSGAHHAIHEAWRLLAVAWQEGPTKEESEVKSKPRGKKTEDVDLLTSYL